MNEPLIKRAGLPGKLVIIGVIALISWIATLYADTVVEDRILRQTEALTEVGGQWGRAQVVGGPILSVPIEVTNVAAGGEKTTSNQTIYLTPRNLAYASDVKTQIRSRGIYETPVYTALVKGSGSFNLDDIDAKALAGATVRWDKAIISLNLSDTRGITSALAFTVAEKAYPFLPSSKLGEFGDSGVHAQIALDQNTREIPFSFEVPINGSDTFSLIPLGQNTEVTMTSDWKSPKFQGDFLFLESPNKASLTLTFSYSIPSLFITKVCSIAT